MLIAWLIFPALLALVCAGCGLLVERMAGVRLPGALVPLAGFALVTAAAHLVTAIPATADLATPLVAGLAVAGLALSLPLRGRRIDGWVIGAGLAVYAVYAAPVLLSGEPTFAGYIKLDDTATWFAFTDRVMEHGRSLDGLPPSTYEATLAANLDKGYPVGAFLPLGVGRALVGQDLAAVFQPYLGLLAALLASALYSLSGAFTSTPWKRALVAFVASQPALLYGYALWGGVKEMTAAALLPLVAALVPQAVTERSWRALVPLALACVALLAVLSFGGVIWIVVLLAGALVAAVRLSGNAAGLRRAGVFAAMILVLLVPLLVAGGLTPPTSSPLSSETARGNLFHPLSVLQVFGVWPVGDFRLRPPQLEITYLLIALAAVLAAAGATWAWRRRAWAPLGYLASTAAGCLALNLFGSTWVDGKALATASPMLLFAAMLGIAWVLQSGHRVEAVAAAAGLAVAVVGGVIWSNALAYHDVNLAPRVQHAELERIAKRIAGQGPTLMTEYEPYGVRHFLRDADPEGASELRRRRVPLRDGHILPKAGFADIDQFKLAGLLDHRTLVLRRSGVASRPPAAYSLISSGPNYEVWQRTPGAPARVREHLPLGGPFQAGAVPNCGQVLRLARRAGKGGLLAYVERSPAVGIPLGAARYPDAWQNIPTNPAVVLPSTPGTLEAGARLPESGRYEVWVGGSFRGRLSVSIDGRTVGVARHRLNNAGQYVGMGSARLVAGPHLVRLDYENSDWHPGSGGEAFPLGPLVLSRQTAALPVRHLPPSRARELCGRRLDWIESLTL